MQEQVFINCMPEDLPWVGEVKNRLELAGLSFCVPPAALDPVTQNELVEKIRAIAVEHGCMLCILSNRAVSNSLFISNIQLMCETARTTRVLVNYQVEPLENDQSIRLFASQAYQVKTSGDPAADTTKVIQRIQQVLHPPSRNIFQFLSRYISRKTLISFFSAALLLGVGGSIVFKVLQPAPVVPLLPTPTPVVLYVPFSGQSQDIGLTVDARSVPDYKPDTDPAAEAPFSFKPDYVLEQQDLNDPTFEHGYDKQKWMVFNTMLDDISHIFVDQANGALQLAIAPTGDQKISLALTSRSIFNPQQTTYLGFRFRLNDYLGRITENSLFTGIFSYQYIDIEQIPVFYYDGMAQKQFSDQMETRLGTRWHTLEMISRTDRHWVDVYLDGKKIDSLRLNDEQLLRWMYFSFNLEAANTSSWVSLQIDEVIFGSHLPYSEASFPENARYRFTPDTVALHEDFETQAYLQAVGKGAEFMTQSGSVLSFRFPPGEDEQYQQLQFPTQPINENNYYATRFRFTSPDDDYWDTEAGLYFGLENQSKINSPDGFELSIGIMRREFSFRGQYGLHNWVPSFTYNHNARPGDWHTLEMIIKPPEDIAQAYTIYYWMDGYLMGKGSLQDPTQFLDAKAPMLATYRIHSGNYRQKVLSGEIDDLVIGTIASDKIKE